MKKILLFFTFLIAALAFTGCEKDKRYKLEATPGELTFEAQADAAQTVTVTAENVNWDVEKVATAEWLHLEKKNGSVSVTVDTNPDTQKREAKFKITGDTDKVKDVEITVIQKPANEPPLTYKLEVDKTELKFDAMGASPQVITVTAENVEWDVSVVADISYFNAVKGDGIVTVTMKDNYTSGQRGGNFIKIVSSVASVPGIDISIEQAGNEDSKLFVDAEAGYYQDYYDVGESNFDMNLYTVEFDGDGNAIGNGYALYLDFFSEKPADEINPDIATGTYKVEDTYKKFTVIPGEYDSEWEWFNYSYVTVIENGMPAGELGVSGGSFTVDRDPESQDYTMTFNLDLSDGTKFIGFYKGSLHVENPFMSNLTGNVNLPKLTEGQLVFRGDYYKNGTYNWIPMMWTSGISVDEDDYLRGNGHIIQLELFSAQEGDGSLLPTGTYTVDDSSEAGTAAPGGMFFGPYACWYLELVDGNISGAMAPFSSGSLTVSYTGETYKMVFDVKDDIGYSITAEFEGALEWFNGVSSSAAVQKISADKRFKKANNSIKRQDMPKAIKPEIGARIR